MIRVTSMVVLALCTHALTGTGAARASAQADTNHAVLAGARVRLLSPVLGPEPRAGTILSASRGESLVFRADGAADRITILTDSITRLELSVGRRSRTKPGGIVGGLAGGAIAFATAGSGCGTAADAGACSTGNAGSATAANRVETTVTGAVLGAAAGAIVGHFWTREKWVAVGGHRD